MTALAAIIFNFLDIYEVTALVGTNEIKWQWFTLGAFILFCVFVGFTYWNLRQRITDLESTKPSIFVEPIISEGFWYLEVTNKGERGIFTAEIIVYGDTYECIGTKYYALWGNTNTDKSEIFNQQNDIVRLACVSFEDDGEYVDMKEYDTMISHPDIVRHIYLSDKIPFEECIEVKISSFPTAKEGVFIRDYILTLGKITEFKKPKNLRRSSSPHHFIFGELSVDDPRFYEAKKSLDEIKDLKIFPDSQLGDLLNVFSNIKDKLSLGMPDSTSSVQDKLVLAQLSLRNIVHREQRQTGDYWVLTELGRNVVLYFERYKDFYIYKRTKK